MYCINLKHREDRKQHSLQQFKKLGIPDYKVIYLPFEKDQRGGVYGCFDSHIKVWKDFFVYHPNETYALIFEDDFVAPSDGLYMLKKAKEFLYENYNRVDLLNIQNFCVPLNDPANNDLFTKGYGLGAGAYMVTRHYIQNIISKFGDLPEPNGYHIDYQINFNFTDKKNSIYTENIFYTKSTCFTQKNDKSDNYVNKLDELTRIDPNLNVYIIIWILRFIKKHKLATDRKTKLIMGFFHKHLCN